MILQDTRTPSTGAASTTTYLYGLGLISETNSDTGVTSYPLTDALGSTTQLANSTGSVTDTYAYDVFGALRSNTGTTANEMRFAGEQTDTNVNRGLQYLRARAYDPALGRFLSHDTIPGGNLYAYAGNDSVNATDPSGECSVDVALTPGASANITFLGHALWYHAYIVTADPLTGEKSVFEGGPEGGHSLGSLGGKLTAFRGSFIGSNRAKGYLAGDRKKQIHDDGFSCSTINEGLQQGVDTIRSRDYRTSLGHSTVIPSRVRSSRVHNSRWTDQEETCPVGNGLLTYPNRARSFASSRSRERA